MDADRRGWPLGKKRTRTDQEELRIINLRKELEKRKFFYGPDTILDKYTKRYPEAPCLSRSFVTRVITKHFPMSRRGTLKAVEEQNYPIETISSLGDIQEEADFLGKKYIQGRSAPLHFFTRVYKDPFTLRLIKRVPNEGSETIMDTFTEDWKSYPVPDVLSIDNGFGFTASGRSPRIISPCIQYFLQVGSTPLFIAPKKPWMNGSVEGTHSVFARKVWNSFDFQDVEEVDETVSRFEEEYRLYTNPPEELPGETLHQDFAWQDVFQKPFQPEDGMFIYLIRLVQEHDDEGKTIPAIRIFKELVELEKSLINTYVLAKLDVYQEHLSIYVEPNNEDLRLVAERRFPLQFAEKRV
ncbi:MAG: hypothetical protein R6U13_09025 [Desulfatiglandaceae bacterium]